MGQWRLNRVGDRFKKLSQLSDEALMHRYSNGNTAAFDALYRRHKDRVFAFLRRQCSNHAIAEELAHDAWLAVIKHVNSDAYQSESYQKDGAFKAWVYRIAHNRLVDFWRKYGQSAAAIFEEITEHSGSTDDVNAYGLELNEIVRHLEMLSAEQLATLLLKIEGFSHCEIAQITTAKHETVKSRLRYATQNLRSTMQATIKV